MAPGRESDGRVVIVLSNGPAIITDAHNGLRVGHLIAETNRAIEIVGKLTNEHQDCIHKISIHHVVRISPYFESASDIESVGRATPEKQPSETRPDDHYDGRYDVDGY